MIDNLRKELKEKRILILGLGKEGKSTYALLRNLFPDKKIAVADKNPEAFKSIENDKNCKFITDDKYLDEIKYYDTVFKSPGIPLKDTDTGNAVITSQTDIFLKHFGKNTIGITGTKGKSTTASLIFHFLQNSRKKSVLLGNIGTPAFDKLSEIDENTVIVFELSAHQLEYVNNSPQVAVLLNIFPEHLDHFHSFESYAKAKLNINKYQDESSLFITNKEILKRYEINKNPEVITIEKEIIDFEPPLKGEHNLFNINAALKAVEFFKIDKNTALDSLKSFNPLPHRLEYVGNYGGIDFYNDSIATIPEATIEAVKTTGKVNTIILGGFDRGLDYAELLCFLRDNPDVKNLIFTGKAGEIMYKMISTQPKNGKEHFYAKDMDEIFEIIKEHTPANSVCLLSPAAASYDQYHNFEHRGDIFKNYARKFTRNTDKT